MGSHANTAGITESSAVDGHDVAETGKPEQSDVAPPSLSPLRLVWISNPPCCAVLCHAVPGWAGLGWVQLV